MGYYELPAYLKRDLRRIYGKPKIIIGATMDEVLLRVEAALKCNRAAIVEAWRSASGFGARATEKMISDRLGCGSDYRRRGDLLIFYQVA